MKKLVPSLFLLFLLCLLIYNLNSKTIGAGDNFPAALLPFNIFMGEGLFFDKFYEYIKYAKPEEAVYYFLPFKEHYISAYPLLGGILSLVIYLPFYLYLSFNNLLSLDILFNQALQLEKLSASILTAFSVVLFYLLIFKISKNLKLSLLFSLIFAFCTQAFSVSSQALWQHTSANLFFIISQLFLILGLGSIRKKRLLIILAIIFALLSFYSRLNFLLYVFLLTGFLFFVDKKNIAVYFLISTVGIALLFIHNIYFYNSLVGGYSVLASNKPKGNFIDSFLGLIFSPSRGMLFYTPFFIFSILIFMVKDKLRLLKEKLLFYLHFSYFILGIFLNSFWGAWWGGHSWGDRLLTDIAPSAVILSFLFYTNSKNKVLKLLFIVLILYSVFTQSLGAFVSTKTKWNSHPTNIDYDTKRLWDFSDSPINRSLKILMDKI